MNYNEEYYDGVYSYLSSHVHSLPIAYFRDGPEGDPLTYYFPSMFVGYALHHAWTMIARAALREVEVSAIETEVDAEMLAEMRRIAATHVGAADYLDRASS
jgi:hypothetical protein